MLGLFYKKLLYNYAIPEWAEDRYFLIATLYPFEKRPKSKTEALAEPLPTPPDFAVALGEVAHSQQGRQGLDTRFERLLDADEQQLPFYLRREIQFLTTAGRKLNWAHLLRDILRWQNPDRNVLRRWA